MLILSHSTIKMGLLQMKSVLYGMELKSVFIKISISVFYDFVIHNCPGSLLTHFSKMYESYLALETFMLHLKSFEYKTIQYCIRDSSVLLSVTWRHFKSPLTSNPFSSHALCVCTTLRSVCLHDITHYPQALL